MSAFHPWRTIACALDWPAARRATERTVKAGLVVAGVFWAALPAMAAAAPPKDAVNGVIRAIKQGADLNAAYPGAVRGKDLELLQRLSQCTAHNLMRQAKGRYTVVWSCGKKVTLGMEVRVTGKQVTSVTTLEVFGRPALER